MIIKLSPQRRDDTLSVTRLNDALIVNGETFDFSKIGEGDTLPAEAISSGWFFDKVERVSGELQLTLLLPNPWNYSPEQAYPVDLVNVPNGLVQFPLPLPVLDTESPNEEQA